MTDDISKRYRKVFRSLGRAELQTGLGDDDILFADLWKDESELILGFYSPEGVETALDEYGVMDEFSKLGFEDVELGIAKHPNGHILRIYDHDRPALIELVFDRATVHVRQEIADILPQPVFSALEVHWLQAQNPEKEFTPERPPLPGQRYPGLGLGKNVFALLLNATKRLGLQAVVTVPSYFHNAVFYANGFQFIDPVFEGRFRALVRDSIDHLMTTYDFKRSTAVAATTWAFEWGLVQRDKGTASEPFEWFHEPLFVPTGDQLKSFPGSKSYRNEVQHILDIESYSIDLEPLLLKLHDVGIRPFDKTKIYEWLEASNS